MTRLRIGTRGSSLALWQARWIGDQLSKQNPVITIELVTISTTGDRKLNVPLLQIGNTGFFTNEIEQALLDNTIDLAVHSLKDLPTELPEGLEIGAYTEREDPRDVFISKNGELLEDLQPHAKIGTSSLRRKIQVLGLRPDLCPVAIRGAVDARLRQLAESEDLSGIVLAAAGVIRMGWTEHITQYFDEAVFLPAPGQGVIALEVSSKCDDIRRLVASINHQPSEYEARAELRFQQVLEREFPVPMAARAIFSDGTLVLNGMVGSLDGSNVVRVRVEGTDPDQVGNQAADAILSQGAQEIISACSAIAALVSAPASPDLILEEQSDLGKNHE